VRRTFALTVVLLAARPLAESSAQQFGRPRPAPSPAARAPTPADEPDPLRPYRPEEEAARGDRLAGRWSAPGPVPRPAPPAARFETSRSYFPDIRAGRGINRNVIDPRGLCVPGRRALLQRFERPPAAPAGGSPRTSSRRAG